MRGTRLSPWIPLGRGRSSNSQTEGKISTNSVGWWTFWSGFMVGSIISSGVAVLRYPEWYACGQPFCAQSMGMERCAKKRGVRREMSAFWGARASTLRATLRARALYQPLCARASCIGLFARTFIMEDSMAPESASSTWPHSFLVKPVVSASELRIAVLDICSFVGLTISIDWCRDTRNKWTDEPSALPGDLVGTAVTAVLTCERYTLRQPTGRWGQQWRYVYHSLTDPHTLEWRL